MTFLLELREAAKATADVLMRKLLKDSADDVETWLKVTYANPTTDNMQRLVGEWTNAARILKNAHMQEPTPPMGGALTEPARLAA